MDDHITQLVEKKNYTQAFKVISTKLKKASYDVPLLIAKARVQLACGGVQLKLCRELCVKLCSRKPPITEMHNVEDLYEITCNLTAQDPTLSLFQEALNLWQEAVKLEKHEELKLALLEVWRLRAIENEQWAMLAQAALTSHRMAPLKSRERKMYFFWYITGRFLTSLSIAALQHTTNNVQQSINQSNNIDRQVAVAFLRKLVKDIPEQQGDQRDEKHGQWISQPSEMKLLCQILNESKEFQLMDETLKNSKLSAVVAQDYAFAYAKEQAILNVADARAHLDWAVDTIRDAFERDSWFEYDNWHYWEALLHAYARLDIEQKSETHNSAAELLELCRAKSTSLRSFQLAKLRLSLDILRDCSSLQSAPVNYKIGYALEYLQCNISQQFLVEDFKYCMDEFNDSEYAELRMVIGEFVERSSQDLLSSRQLAWLVSETNVLCLDFMKLETTLVRPLSAEDLLKLHEFVANSMRLYRVSRTHTEPLPAKAMDPGDLACQLACSALSRATDKTDNVTYAIRGLCLLDFLMEQSKYNFKAQLDFVALAIDFGFHSLAWEAYKKLDVKKVLHESLAPKMFSRISLICPFGSDKFDPHEAMETPLKFYADTLKQIPEYQEIALQHENYASAIEMKEFSDHMRHSPTRIMMVFERRRIARLTGKKYEEAELVFDANNFPQPKPIQVRNRSGYTHKANATAYGTSGPSIDELDTTTADTSNHDDLGAKRFCASFCKSDFSVAHIYLSDKMAVIHNDDYIKWLMYIDVVFELATTEDPDRVEALEKCAEQCRDIAESSTSPDGDVARISPCEFVVLAAATMLHQLVKLLNSQPTTLKPMVVLLQRLITNLASMWPKSSRHHASQRANILFPTAAWYGDSILALEFYQVCNKLAYRVEKYANGTQLPFAQDTKTWAVKFQIVNQRMSKDVHNEAETYRDNLRKAIADGTIVEKATGIRPEGAHWDGHGIDAEVLRLLGYERVRRMVGIYAGQAVVSLEGVLKVKLPPKW